MESVEYGEMWPAWMNASLSSISEWERRHRLANDPEPVGMSD